MAVRLWNASMAVAERQVGARDVCFVDFAAFVRSPAVVLGAIESWFRVPADRPAEVESPDAILRNEAWKAGANEALQVPASKWTKLFSPSVRAAVEARLEAGRLERVWASDNAIRGDGSEPGPGAA